MNALKIIIGVLASLYVFAHFLELPRFLERLDDVEPTYRSGMWAGKFFGIVIGSVIAFACFRRKRESSK